MKSTLLIPWAKMLGQSVGVFSLFSTLGFGMMAAWKLGPRVARWLRGLDRLK
jgi:hypothetical protein